MTTRIGGFISKKTTLSPAGETLSRPGDHPVLTPSTAAGSCRKKEIVEEEARWQRRKLSSLQMVITGRGRPSKPPEKTRLADYFGFGRESYALTASGAQAGDKRGAGGNRCW